jgi:hypothetical protein
MLHKDYDSKSSAGKKKKKEIADRECQGTWRQDELVRAIPPLAK